MSRATYLVGVLVTVLAAGCGGSGGSGDGGSDGGGQLSDCGFDPAVQWGAIAPILQMASADGSTCVWLRRQDDCPPDMICKAHPFTVLEMRVGHNGTVVSEDDPAAFTWTATHHNWMDTGTAVIAGTTYTLQGVDEGAAFELTAAGAETFGPIHLEPWVP